MQDVVLGFLLSNDKVEKDIGSGSFVGEAQGSLMELRNGFTSLPAFSCRWGREGET